MVDRTRWQRLASTTGSTRSPAAVMYMRPLLPFALAFAAWGVPEFPEDEREDDPPAAVDRLTDAQLVGQRIVVAEAARERLAELLGRRLRTGTPAQRIAASLAEAITVALVAPRSRRGSSQALKSGTAAAFS